jgi:hypothetical protein
MSKIFLNPKFFAAATLLFAAATIFNANASPSATSNGMGIMMMAPAPAISEPVLKVGPTLPPSPWEDDAPAIAGANNRT